MVRAGGAGPGDYRGGPDHADRTGTRLAATAENSNVTGSGETGGIHHEAPMNSPARHMRSESRAKIATGPPTNLNGH